MKRIAKLFLPVLLLTGILSTGRASAAEVSVCAAASLRDVVGDLTAAYGVVHPGVKVTASFGGSGAIARQIENGAPCDLFISADEEWVDYLAKKGLLDNAHRRVFARNEVVFVGANPRAAKRLADLPGLRYIAVCPPKVAPIGTYAMQSLTRAGVAQKLAGKIVMSKDVRAALILAESGDVDGAFVYLTDAIISRKVTILFRVPADLHSPIVYGMAPVGRPLAAKATADFYGYLASPPARKIIAAVDSFSRNFQ